LLKLESDDILLTDTYVSVISKIISLNKIII